VERSEHTRSTVSHEGDTTVKFYSNVWVYIPCGVNRLRLLIIYTYLHRVDESLFLVLSSLGAMPLVALVYGTEPRFRTSGVSFISRYSRGATPYLVIRGVAYPRHESSSSSMDEAHNSMKYGSVTECFPSQQNTMPERVHRVDPRVPHGLNCCLDWMFRS
jgi:hypothetical protein